MYILKETNSKTPLMTAAHYGADEVVEELLRWERGWGTNSKILIRVGANPNATSHNGFTPLAWAIWSKCPSTISLLAPVTNVGLETVFDSMNIHHMELPLALSNFLT